MLPMRAVVTSLAVGVAVVYGAAPCTAAPAPACLPATASLTYVAGDEDGLQLCYNEDREGIPVACAAAVLNSSPYAVAPWTRPEVRVSSVRGVDNRAVEVCEGKGACKTFPLGGLLDQYSSVEQVAVVNRKIGRLAVLTGAQEDGSGPPMLELYDLKSGERLRSRPMTRDRPAATSDYRCGDLAWLGDTLLVRTNVCAGPGGQSWLARGRDLRPIGLLGTAKMNTYGARPIHVAGRRWAFLTAFSRELVVQDVVRGKVLRVVKLEGLWDTGDEDPDWLAAWADGRVAVVKDGDDFGRVIVFGARGKTPVSTLEPVRCAPLPPGQ